MNLKNRKVLITGGSGFIGTHLLQKLEELGATVDNFDLVNGNNLEDPNDLKKFVKRKYDYIYHLAGFSGSEKSNQEKIKCLSLNTFSFASLLELLIKYSPNTKLILSGSRLEYGIPKYLPVDENHPTIPISIYGLSKLAATQLALVYHMNYNLDVTIFRTSNVYGPHKSSSFPGYNLINYFIDQAKKDKELTIYGKGDQERDYIFIHDLVDAFVLSFDRKTSGEIYNLGFGKGIQIKSMAKLITKTVGKGRVTYKPWPKNFQSVETGSYISDIRKIKSLGFKPKTNFKEGILKTCQIS
ncbi:MAG: NAD-dependent epimerase/dehydratase family protein [Candidatus Curtissbacteria bacterium]|nr:NAD-dependent epimerase/dehydratase family protein [Candidatus Curtissbacteria bacterium]